MSVIGPPSHDRIFKDNEHTNISRSLVITIYAKESDLSKDGESLAPSVAP